MKEDLVSYFLYVLKCFYRNEECLSPKTQIDLRDIYVFSKCHNLQNIVFGKIKDIECFKNSEYYNVFKKEAFILAGNSITIDEDINMFSNILNNNNISHTFFKGAVLRKCYPSIDCRTMGDVDVFVEKGDIPKLKEALANTKFLPNAKHDHSNVYAYKYYKTKFEIHENIASRNCMIHKGDFVSFFSNADDNKVLVENNTYMFTPEYHLVYLVYHLLKHFERKGCGLRFFLDFPFFIDKYREQIDWKTVEKWLEELKLTDFCDGVFQFCNHIFGSRLPQFGNNNLDEDTMNYLVKLVCRGGIFGYYNTESYHHKIISWQIKNSESSKLKTIFRLVFPTREEMYHYHCWDIKIPLVFLPFGYIKRICKSIFLTDNSNKDKKRETELIKKMGLDN